MSEGYQIAIRRAAHRAGYTPGEYMRAVMFDGLTPDPAIAEIKFRRGSYALTFRLTQDEFENLEKTRRKFFMERSSFVREVLAGAID